MSDESPTPPLRLRPHPRNDQAAAGAPVVPPRAVEAVPPVASTEAAPRLRLKPKLTVEADKSEPAIPAATSSPAPPPSASTAQQPAEPSRLKLRQGPATNVSAPASPALPSEPAKTEVIPALTPLSVLKTDPPESSPQAGADVSTAAGISASPPPLARPPVRRSSRRAGRTVGVVALLLLVAGGYCAYRIFMPASPAAGGVSGEVPVAKKTVVPPPAVAATQKKSSPTVTASVPKASVSPREARAAVHVEPASPPPAPAHQTVVAAPVEPPPAPAPGVDFLTWVDAVKISGVVNGVPPRAIVNGLLVSPGETVDSVRGIVFDHLDPADKRFFFRDRSGAVASRTY